MNILFTLCARSGSKGYKNKNFRDFLGFPIYLYSLSIIDLFKKNHPELAAHIVFNSDSLELKETLEKTIEIDYKFLDRDKNLSGDLISKFDVIKNSYFKSITVDINYDYVIDIDITSPLRRLIDLENVYSKIINSKADLVFTVVESRRSPYFNMVQKNDIFYERVISSLFNTRQAVPKTYDMNASVYSYKTQSLIKKNHLNEFNSDIIHMEENYVLDIDSERDFKFMEIIASQLFDTNPDYNAVRENINNILII